MFREELSCSSADLVFFQALCFLGDLLYADPSIATPFLDDLIRQIQHFATILRLAPARVKQSKTVYMPRELKTCTHIFVKQDPIKPYLTPVYSGPFLVVSRTDKTFRILSNGRVISVAVNNVKPCFRLKNSEEISHDSTLFMITLQIARKILTEYSEILTEYSETDNPELSLPYHVSNVPENEHQLPSFINECWQLEETHLSFA